MKRKCNALLALLLAVCMVLPMGVFVGAVDPEIKLTVAGSIDAITGEVLDEDLTGDSLTAYVAVEGFVDITVSYPSDYTLKAESSNNGVTRLQDNGGGVYRIIGTSTYGDATDTITFTASKKSKPDLVATVTVNVKEPVITKMDVSFTEVSLDPEKTNSCKPGDVVEVQSIDYYLSNGHKEENAQGTVKYSVNNGAYGEDPITIKGGDTVVSVYFEDTRNLQYTKENSYDIIVTGKTIEAVTLSPKADEDLVKYDESAVISDADVRKNILISVTYKNESPVDVFDNYTLRYVNLDTDKESESLTNLKIADRNKYNVYVVYDGAKSNTVALSSIIKINEKTPKSFTMDVRNATKKDYIEGETLDDFGGITVTVTYTDKTEKTFKGDEIKALNLVIHPFVYGDKSIIVEYGDLLAKVDVSYLNISQKKVTKIDPVTSSMSHNLQYDVGDRLDLTGLQIKLTYNDGTSMNISYSDPRIECSPANGSVISATDKKLFIAYTDPATGEQLVTTLTLQVTTNKKLLSADLAYGSTGKTEYFIGEKFDTTGFRVTLYYNDNTKETLSLNSDKLTVAYKLDNGSKTTTAPTFSSAQSGYITLYLVRSGCKGEAELLLSLSVTKRPVLKDISVYAKKTEYLVGETPMVKDFVITALYDDGSKREFSVAEDDVSAEKNTITVTKDGVTYTVKFSPTYIEAETKKITVSYTENVKIGTVSTKTIEAEVEIKVTVPDCILTTYTKNENNRYTYKKIPYESIVDALEDSVDGDELVLCRDVTMTTDYASKKSLDIDLAGYTLIMIRGEIYVASSASSTTKITFTNSARDDAHIRYTNNEDEDVIISYNKEYEIDRSSKGDGRYEVKITSAKNGKVTGPVEVIHGHDAKFTITPDEGYEIAAIKVNSKSYNIPKDNILLIEDVREKLTVTVTFQEKAWENPFTDVSKYATYYQAVQFVYENGLFNGTSATKFEPDTTMTRAMFVTVLGRLAGVNVDDYKTSSFTDVATGQWYSEYVEWASSIGLVEGYGNGKFGPNDPITHAQMYVLMERYADIIEGKNTSASGATISANDVRDIPDWAYESVEYAARNDFLVISSYKLTPMENAKRAELAMLLQKFCTNILGM